MTCRTTWRSLSLLLHLTTVSVSKSSISPPHPRFRVTPGRARATKRPRHPADTDAGPITEWENRENTRPSRWRSEAAEPRCRNRPPAAKPPPRRGSLGAYGAPIVQQGRIRSLGLLFFFISSLRTPRGPRINGGERGDPGPAAGVPAACRPHQWGLQRGSPWAAGSGWRLLVEREGRAKGVVPLCVLPRCLWLVPIAHCLASD